MPFRVHFPTYNRSTMPRSTKAFARKWTDEQTAAISHAMLDRKPRLTARQAVAAAARGELCDQHGQRLEAFGPMPINSAQFYARQERLNRAVRSRGRLSKATDADTAMRIVLTESWDDLDKARERRRKSTKRIGYEQETRAIRNEVQAAQAILQAELELMKPRRGKPAPAPTGDQAGNGKPQDSKAARGLIREARERAKTPEIGEADGETGRGDDQGAEHPTPTAGAVQAPGAVEAAAIVRPGALLAGRVG